MASVLRPIFEAYASLFNTFAHSITMLNAVFAVPWPTSTQFLVRVLDIACEALVDVTWLPCLQSCELL